MVGEKDLLEIIGLKSYFVDAVLDSVERRQLEISELAQSYVVNLLAVFLRAENFFDSYERKADGSVEKFLQSLTFAHVTGPEPKRLGDKCLFLTGFMYDFTRRYGPAQVRYYGDVGSSAYIAYAKSHAEVKQLYFELARKFWDLSDVISDLSQPESYTDRQLMEIFFKYRQELDRRHEEILTKCGFVLNKNYLDKNYSDKS